MHCAARCGAKAAGVEEERARPFCWQDEQHAFVHGMEDELADMQSMGSLGNPPALFLMVNTEAMLVKRLEAEAVALRARLEGATPRTRRRRRVTGAVDEAGGAGAGTREPRVAT